MRFSETCRVRLAFPDRGSAPIGAVGSQADLVVRPGDEVIGKRLEIDCFPVSIVPAVRAWLLAHWRSVEDVRTLEDALIEAVQESLCSTRMCHRPSVPSRGIRLSSSESIDQVATGLASEHIQRFQVSRRQRAQESRLIGRSSGFVEQEDPAGQSTASSTSDDAGAREVEIPPPFGKLDSWKLSLTVMSKATVGGRRSQHVDCL